MIQPEDIRRKAENLYADFQIAWLEGEPFFPRSIPADRRLDTSDHSGAIAALQRLRDGSKVHRGFGYSIEWKEKNSRAFGRNPFPSRIYFETQEDFLRFIAKQSEFEAFAGAVERLKSEFPALNGWIRSHRKTLTEVESELDGLLHVLQFFRSNPRPNRFARELPLPVDTKFIERHERVLREWFDLILPPETIRSDENHFARRFGLLAPEMHVMVRFLDTDLQHELGIPWPELSLPISALAKLSVASADVIIVENKVNLLTLPARPRAIGLGALGRAVTELRYVAWLSTTPIIYWGDLDVEGFEILSSLRAAFPHVRSLLMDEAAIFRYRSISTSGNATQPLCPPHLTKTEIAAFEFCRQENARIEQERIPVIDAEAAISGYCRIHEV